MKTAPWLLIPAIFSVNPAFAQPAQRSVGAAWQDVASRAMNFSSPPKGSALASALEAAVGVSPVVDQGKTYSWTGSRAEMQQAFELARDSRVVHWRADFPRRPSWLYPDDGCYARAVVAADTLKRSGMPIPGKIFAFGDLAATTSRSPVGRVSWWYHVAVAYQFAGDVFVFDPSVEETRPLALAEWTDRLGGDATLRTTFCDTKTYSPSDNCQHGNMMTTTSGFRDQQLYLDLEWDRLLEMGKDPTSMLGPSPLWQ